MKLSTLVTTALAAVLGLMTVPVADAREEGIFDVARSGCGCHSGPVPSNLTTQVILDGLPAAYGPGCTYSIRVFVLGPALPTPAFAGFNLETSAGTLDAPAGGALTRNLSECAVYERNNGCKFDPAPNEIWCGRKEHVGCSDELVTDAQATHDIAARKDFSWDLEWTAPSDGSGSVTFHLAGNVVNGDGEAAGIADLWAVGDPTTIAVDPAAACP